MDSQSQISTLLPNKRLLIVDDDPAVVAILAHKFEKKGLRVNSATSIADGTAVLAQFSFDAIILDVKLGEEDGLSALPQFLKYAPFSRIFMLSAYPSIDVAVKAMTKGAAGFIPKTRPADQVVEDICSQLRKSENERKVNTDFDCDLNIVGKSPATLELTDLIRKLGKVDSTVLITGESGTGKELVARGLHACSSRRANRFEAINCGAIPATLLESELFGYKRGAFTDAKSDRKGIFEVCSGGTLFLDEIGEMPFELQSKLLRVLQEKVVTPIGSSTPVSIDTRIIAATNRNLGEEVAAGKFREDLWFRLSVIPIFVPALRERREDIPLLVSLFLKQFNERFNKTIANPNSEVMAHLMAQEWPGNIRELQNAIERGVVLANGNQLELENIFLSGDQMRGQAAEKEDMDSELNLENWFKMPLREAKQEFEKAYVENLLRKSRWNVTAAARFSGRYRADLYRLMARYNIRTPRAQLAAERELFPANSSGSQFHKRNA